MMIQWNADSVVDAVACWLIVGAWAKATVNVSVNNADSAFEARQSCPQPF